jgi:hypothetical protein
MIPIAFSIARGTPAALPLDVLQRREIMLTVLQSTVAVLLLLNMKFDWWDATLLFVLWLAQFLVPEWRDWIGLLYAAWIVGLVLSWIWVRPTAPGIFRRLLRDARTLPLS